MNIVLIGYGKMGQAIEKVAVSRGHSIVHRITSANAALLNPSDMSGVEVAIEFTRPEAAKENVLKCLAAGVRVVCGTTGWNEQVPEAAEIAKNNGLAFLQASNFSIGVNIFFEINKRLAALMNGHAEYNLRIEETHHTAKKDAPSGTAITLAEQVIDNLQTKNEWILGSRTAEGQLPIVAHRVEHVPGTHKVTYSSAIDDIEIIHTAHSRDGFALGAVLAAEYIAGKSGVFSMKDVLGI